MKKEFLNDSMYKEINKLQDICVLNDKTSLKLELDYKLTTGKLSDVNSDQLNEFLYYNDSILVGYIGISVFSKGEIEINGMVHPSFRGKGLFTKMFKEVMKECGKRDYNKIMLLSDHNSVSGIAFIKSIKGIFDFSEYEMHLSSLGNEIIKLSGLSLRKATNRDASAIAKQNKIYFKDIHEEETDKYESLILPEEEEKKGMTIYLAEVNNLIIGKVNLYIKDYFAAIFGLGVLPEYRRKGYGRAVLLKSLEIFREQKCSTVMLQVVANNDKALNLYLNCGFKVISTMDYYKI